MEQIVGQKQIVIDFQDKMFDIASEMFGVDIKKTFPQTIRHYWLNREIPYEPQ
nr:hypothetical protein [Candidatus Brachybacter algidus]